MQRRKHRVQDCFSYKASAFDRRITTREYRATAASLKYACAAKVGSLRPREHNPFPQHYDEIYHCSPCQKALYPLSHCASARAGVSPLRLTYPDRRFRGLARVLDEPGHAVDAIIHIWAFLRSSRTCQGAQRHSQYCRSAASGCAHGRLIAQRPSELSPRGRAIRL